MIESCAIRRTLEISLESIQRLTSEWKAELLELCKSKNYKSPNRIPNHFHQEVKSSRNHLPLELASNALSNKRDISPAVAVLSRHLSELVGAAEHARAPASPSKVNVRVLVKNVQLLAHGFQAARVGRSATSLGQDGLTLVLAQPVAESGERIGVVGGAGGVGAAVVGVEVLVHVEDEVCCAAVEVGDFDQSAAGAVGDECTR